MKVSMIFKTFLVALSMVFLTACMSTSDSDSATDETNKDGTEQTANADGSVETGTMDSSELTEEEQLVEKYGDSISEVTVWFAFDKSTVSSEYAETLDAHSKYLVDNADMKVTIEGHADEKGTPEYNVALGERRAMAVSRYLQNNGVSEGQISVVSYGEEKPLNMNHDAEAHAENRRATLVY